MSTAQAARDAPRLATDDGLAVYVHWPFCESKCPYCNFNSHVRDSVDETRWRRALITELDHAARPLGGRTVTSVFFGGGTPSLMSPATAAALIERVTTLWTVAEGAEITLEANPSAAEAVRFEALHAAGVNRLSLGIQALDDAALQFLGRRHDLGEALEAARACFPRISFDLIYARPGQDREAWIAELDRALAHEAEHMSLYQLTIEEGTAFHTAHRRGEFRLPDEAEAARLFEATQARMAAAGLPAYEISNHARPGAECRHNLTYWQGGDYIGIGPGAHGRLSLSDDPSRARRASAVRRIPGPEAWLAQVEGEGHGTREEFVLDQHQRIEELVLMGLRLTAGIARERIHRLTGMSLEEALPETRVGPLVAEGLLELDGTGLRTTPAGRLRLDAVIAYLLA